MGRGTAWEILTDLNVSETPFFSSVKWGLRTKVCPVPGMLNRERETTGGYRLQSGESGIGWGLLLALLGTLAACQGSCFLGNGWLDEKNLEGPRLGFWFLGRGRMSNSTVCLILLKR